jgi:hypothetical protein
MWNTSWDEYKRPVYEKWKSRWLSTHPPEVGNESWEYLFTGGKEIRARLFCDLWESLTPDSSPPNAELAFAIECIHAASLVLDDTPWMDNAATRRGRKTLHLVFSDKKALLIAHDVIRMVCEIWYEQCPSHLSRKDWNAHLIRIMERLAIGQWYDLEKQGSLMELASLKTGVLFEGVTETVARCLSLDIDFWSGWGNTLGILFQWADDWEDREEDKLQNNRNAFIEEYDNTLREYDHLWNQLQTYMGSSWFDRPLGQTLVTYFTKQQSADFPLYREIKPMTPLRTLQELSTFPSCPAPIIRTDNAAYQASKAFSISGVEMIRNLIQMIRSRRLAERMSDSFLSPDLWSHPEEKWGDHPECMELLTELYSADGVTIGR